MFGWNLQRFLESEVSSGKTRREANAMAVERISRLVENKQIRPEEVSLREMAIAFCGERWAETLNPASSGNADEIRRAMEATDAVDVTAFTNIIGQITYTAVHRGWESEAFIGEKLTRNVPTKLMSEKIPGFEGIADSMLKVHETMPFPYYGFGESYQVTPETAKYGGILALSKEAIFFDRTGMFLMNGEKLGNRLRIRKEKEILDVVIGALNNYNWRGMALNTYIAGTLTPGLWINALSGNPLVSWKSIDISLQAFQSVRDPETGDPIIVGGNTILVPPGLKMTARRIVTATTVRETSGSSIVNEYSPSPLEGSMEILSSQLLLDRIMAPADASIGRVQVEDEIAKANNYWWHGDFPKAFWYMENWPLTIAQAGPQSEAEFERDIIWRQKVSERGVAAVYDPRYVRKNYNT